jgi:hypothetical protein
VASQEGLYSMELVMCPFITWFSHPSYMDKIYESPDHEQYNNTNILQKYVNYNTKCKIYSKINKIQMNNNINTSAKVKFNSVNEMVVVAGGGGTNI